MKNLAILIIIYMSMAAQADSSQIEYPSMVTFRIIDDAGSIVTNGEVRISTFSHWVSGEGFGRDDDRNYSAALDDKGRASFEVINVRGAIAYGVYPNSNYYPVLMQTYQFRQIESGRWEPWNPEISVVLPRKLNPIPLYARRIGNGPDLEMPILGPVGFDLEVSDWVAPHGKGKRPDVIIERKTIIPATHSASAFESVFTVTFANVGDGIQSYPVGEKRRLLDLPRYAPKGGYASRITKRVVRVAEGSALDNETRGDQNYFFRVRTVLDANGEVVSALYGKIYGDIHFFVPPGSNGMVRFTYYMNPNSLDRNLEFDPKRNLLPERLVGTNISEP